MSLKELRDLIVVVESVRGRCPVYKKGDRMVFEGGYDLDLDRSDALCSHAMASLIPFMASLSHGVDPRSLGLSRKGGMGHVQCPDPGKPYTDGGTVTFAIQYRE